MKVSASVFIIACIASSSNHVVQSFTIPTIIQQQQQQQQQQQHQITTPATATATNVGSTFLSTTTTTTTTTTSPSRLYMATEASDSGESPPSTSTSTNAADADANAAAAGSDSDFKPSMTVYERLGVPKDKVAIGIDVNQLLQWMGNKEDIVQKFLRDNKNFDRERAEAEVDKLLMDAELVNAYIKFEKTKDTRDLRGEAEQTLSDPQTWLTYVAWIVGGAGFSYVRKFVIEPKYASGEWEPLHINLDAIFGGTAATEEAAAQAAAAVNADVAAVAAATFYLGHH